MGEQLQTRPRRMLTPLVSREFLPGQIKACIKSIEDADERAMAWSGYYQYTGNAEKAFAIASKYVDHDDPTMRMSAYINCFISGQGKGDWLAAKKALAELEGMVVKGGECVDNTYLAKILKNMISLHEENDVFDKMGGVARELPDGARFFATYFYALRCYGLGEYERAAGISKAAATLCGSQFPIPAIYLNIATACSSLMLHNMSDAEVHFVRAWELAEPDGLLAAFGQNYVLLGGLVKKALAESHPEQHRAIVAYSERFIPSWVRLVADYEDKSVDADLTRMEGIVSLLFREGFSEKEISETAGISINTVKTHLSNVYAKQNIHKRSEISRRIKNHPK